MAASQSRAIGGVADGRDEKGKSQSEQKDVEHDALRDANVRRSRKETQLRKRWEFGGRLIKGK